MLIVVESGDPGPYLDAEAKKLNYSWTEQQIFPCHKKHLNQLESRRLDDCFTQDCRVSKWHWNQLNSICYSCIAMSLKNAFFFVRSRYRR